jgi:NiFe hydrogenase small subunit HydA
MNFSRREFLKVAAAAVVAGKLGQEAFAQLQKALGRSDAPRVIWLQGSGCDGCAISFLNSIALAPVDELLTGTVNLQFQSNLMSAAGELAISAVDAAGQQPGYILVIEGAIPVGEAGRYCRVWTDTNMDAAVTSLAENAAYIVALGACASFGGVTSGNPNPTQALGVGEFLGDDPRLINLPGCPAHPDWLVGTLTYLITAGQLPPLDAHRRPLEYYGNRIHDFCFKRRKHCGEPIFAPGLSQDGCMEFLGCKGKHTYADCPVRKWNSSGPDREGVNWCVGSRSPCIGCVNPTFPDGMSPFYEYLPAPDGPAADSQGGPR